MDQRLSMSRDSGGLKACGQLHLRATFWQHDPIQRRSMPVRRGGRPSDPLCPVIRAGLVRCGRDSCRVVAAPLPGVETVIEWSCCLGCR